MLELLTAIAMWCAVGESVRTATTCKRETLKCVLTHVKGDSIAPDALERCFLRGERS